MPQPPDEQPKPRSDSKADSGAALPVFYDAHSRRWPLVVRLGVPAALLVAAATVTLLVSAFAVVFMPRSPLPRVQIVSDIGNMEPILGEHTRRKLAFAQARDVQRLRVLQAREAHARRTRVRKAQAFLAAHAPAQPATVLAPSTNAPSPVVAGFYVNWEETSPVSVHRHISALTHFIPEWLHLKASGYNYANPNPQSQPFVDARERALDKNDITPFVRAHGVPILPMINNYTQPPGADESAADWDTRAVHDIVSSAAARAQVISHLKAWLIKNQMQGVNVDFEEVDTDDKNGLTQFMTQLWQALHPLGLMVTEDVEVGSNSYDLPKLAAVTNWIVPMLYDEHAGGTLPGPVAGVDWTVQNLRKILQQVPASKIVMGVGNHGYDWLKGTTTAEDLTFQSAVITAKESQPDAVIHLAPGSLNPTYQYADVEVDQHGNQRALDHVVWMQDAVSVYNQLLAAKPYGVRGAALWFMGAEDPTIWSFLNKAHWNDNWTDEVQAGILNTVSYGGQAEVDFEGDGELLQPVANPSDGHRVVTVAPDTGLATAETYRKDPATGAPMLPTASVIRRYGGGSGNPNKRILLTFDDGPDPTYTPQILDILQKYHVPALFFVVGRNAEAWPDDVRREWDMGDDIGNHSWSHPDLFELSHESEVLQLNTTQRVIQAITGHSTTLFRPPYGGDVEPQTAREVEPMIIAAQLGYITVGETNDPQDWRLFELKPGTAAVDMRKPRDAQEIINSVIDNRDVGSIVLLHDAGGDRSRTVAALPVIINKLRSLGYTFITIEQLRGLPRDRLMPRISGRDILLIGADQYIFEVVYALQRTLTTLFLLSIILGFSRVGLLVTLALIQRWRERFRVPDPTYAPTVSVVIAAFNEAPVIERTVNAILKSDYPGLQVIVVDDGSTDGTGDTASAAFADNPIVHVITKPNGGKASALNRGLEDAFGDIVVSLDADTLFTPDTIRQLVEHFSDPRVGAVSGNVRVGNVGNLLTRWQSVEYITSQNFDRRGYDLLNCITVVPGAVGALRRDAVTTVGGYKSDTLAEDTDLTWRLRRAGYRIVNDNEAIAYTEAPETLHNLARQRFRWAFGTLQCLWKHRDALFDYGAFGWFVLPSLWIYQVLLPAISPIMDITVVWSLFEGNFSQIGLMYLAFALAELLAGAIAIRMDRGDYKLLFWLFFQRFVYRQLMYYVMLKSLIAAVRGGAVGWGKFERTGNARMQG